MKELGEVVDSPRMRKHLERGKSFLLAAYLLFLAACSSQPLINFNEQNVPLAPPAPIGEPHRKKPDFLRISYENKYYAEKGAAFDKLLEGLHYHARNGGYWESEKSRYKKGTDKWKEAYIRGYIRTFEGYIPLLMEYDRDGNKMLDNEEASPINFYLPKYRR